MPHYLIGEKKLASKHIMVAYTESSRIERRLSTTQQFSIDDVIYYNYKVNGDPSVLNCPQTDTEDDHPILRGEVEAAAQSLKKGKSAGVDNIPEDLVQTGGEDVITALTTICNKIWQTGEWPTPWTQSLVITPAKKGSLQQCQNYRTVSLISHLSSHAEDHTEQIEATSGEDHR